MNRLVDDERIYLTGLSMGGRGSFIVAADLPETFAAIMPLSPHHGPYSYVPLAKKVKEMLVSTLARMLRAKKRSLKMRITNGK